LDVARNDPTLHYKNNRNNNRIVGSFCRRGDTRFDRASWVYKLDFTHIAYVLLANLKDYLRKNG